MSKYIIVIGAGAAGLMAARTLSGAGIKVTILEAAGRIGGRIYTVYDGSFTTPIELGAEFVHGYLPVTMALLQEANIPVYKAEGDMLRVDEDHEAEKRTYQIDHWKLFEERIKALKEDMTVNAFLNDRFPEEEYKDLRDSVRQYAAGYDTADPAKASAFALREEWISEKKNDNYRVVPGYQKMIDYLSEQCIKQGCELLTDSEVKEIKWEAGGVTVLTAQHKKYTAAKVIVTIPLSLLQREAITFVPEIPDVTAAVRQMGMGAVIKVLLQFTTAFWESDEISKNVGKKLDKTAFLFSKEKIPTWWTQCPRESTLLTGWLGGPKAELYKDTRDETILSMALVSLASIFRCTPEYIEQQLAAWKVANWTSAQYSMGSYSYATAEAREARAVIERPGNDIVYFAGEAFYDGVEMGTVEAALASGIAVAKSIVG